MPHTDGFHSTSSMELQNRVSLSGAMINYSLKGFQYLRQLRSCSAMPPSTPSCFVSQKIAFKVKVWDSESGFSKTCTFCHQKLRSIKESLMCPRFQWNPREFQIHFFSFSHVEMLTAAFRVELPSWEPLEVRSSKNDHIWPPGCCSTLVSTDWWALIGNVRKKKRYNDMIQETYCGIHFRKSCLFTCDFL